MSKKLFFILLCSPLFAFGQNLVPNPSFEVFDTCPNWYGQIFRAQSWFAPTPGTPDYFNSCDTTSIFGYVDVPNNFCGYQYAKTGAAYSGGFFSYNYLDYREYIEVKINSPLSIGTKYFISFYVSLADSQNYATDELAAHFSVDTLKQDTFSNIPVIPLISNPSGNFMNNKTLWIPVSGSFIADSAYEFITIGNFKNDINTDSVLVSGGGSSSSEYYRAYYYIDDVCVSNDSLTCLIGVGVNNLSLPNNFSIYPTVSSGDIHVNFYDTKLNIAEAKIYNVLGDEIMNYTLIEKMNTINISYLDAGIYFLKLQLNNNELTQKIILTK